MIDLQYYREKGGLRKPNETTTAILLRWGRPYDGLFFRAPRTQQNKFFVTLQTIESAAGLPEQPEEGTPAPSLRLSRQTAAFSLIG